MTDATSYIKMKFAIVILLSAFCGILANADKSYCGKRLLTKVLRRRVALTTSSDWNTLYGPERSALFTTTATGPIAAWCSRTNDKNQWIQADFGSPRKVTSVLLQGRGDCCERWVTSFRILYSDDGEMWQKTEAIVGTSNRDTVQRRYLDQPIIGRYFRLNPITWHNQICLRFDLIGCKT